MNDGQKQPEVTLQIPQRLRKLAAAPEYTDMGLQESCPFLFELLRPAYDTKRNLTWEGSTLKIRVMDGYLCVTVTCPTSRVQTVIKVESLINVAEQVELALSASDVVWRPTYDAVKDERREMEKAKKNIRS